MSHRLFPVIPLRDAVLFPGVIMPLFVGRAKTRAALEQGGSMFFVAQKNANIENPSDNELFDLGTLGDVLQSAPTADGSLKIVVKGLRRARAVSFTDNARFLQAELALLGEERPLNLSDFSVQAGIEKAARIEWASITPWPVARLQALLEDESMSDADRLTRIKDMFRST